MLRERLSVYRDRIRREFTAALEEEHTDREIAASFAIGVFVTAMPTGGLGLGLFVVLAYYLEWVSKTAIFASAVVLNPLVKPVVYVASYQLGALAFGTEPVTVFDRPLADAAVTAVQLLVLGNLLIALVLAAAGYALSLWIAREHRRRRETGRQLSPAAAFSSFMDRLRR